MVGGDGIVNGPWWVMVGYEESSVKRLVDSILKWENGERCDVKIVECNICNVRMVNQCSQILITGSPN